MTTILSMAMVRSSIVGEELVVLFSFFCFYWKMLLILSPLAMSTIGTDAEDGPVSKRRKTKKVVSGTEQITATVDAV